MEKYLLRELVLKFFFAQRDIITNYEICVERKLQRVELINLKCIYNNLFSGYVYTRCIFMRTHV